MRNFIYKLTTMILFAMTAFAGHAVNVADSTFLKEGRPVIFKVSHSEVSSQDADWLLNTLKPQVMSSSFKKVIVRTASSPEGPLYFNVKLSGDRYAAVKKYFNRIGIPESKVSYEVISEDYRMLIAMMQAKKDKDLAVVQSLYDKYAQDTPQLKQNLLKCMNGVLWKRLLKEYFPALRAVRIILVDEQKNEVVSLPQTKTLDPVNHMGIQQKSGAPCFTCGSRESDSIFLHNSKAVVFDLRRTVVKQEYAKYIMDSLSAMVSDSTKYRKICVRTSSSPEGPLYLNKILSKNRYKVVKDYFNEIGIPDDKLSFEVISEDYRMLYQMMRENNDPELHIVDGLLNKYADNTEALKAALMKVNGGQTWKRLNREYFPQLRATRFMVIEDGQPVKAETAEPQPEVKPEPAYKPMPQEKWVTEADTIYKREKWSVKTNMLFYGAYVPQYGYCPIPNVAIEYYPLHGHWTYGASLDCPWWVGTTENHKYFQIRNYQLEARRYFKSGDIDVVGLGNGKAFRGWYLQAYAHMFLYGIGFSEKKGWQGEGVGAGLGLGYVMPLGKHNRWSLEFGAQFGSFITKYDPYQYGCPVEDIQDGLYYYKWTGSANLFRKRQYQYTYFGPTRIGVTLTYNLLYRKSTQPNNYPAKGSSIKKVTTKSRKVVSKLVKIKK